MNYCTDCKKYSECPNGSRCQNCDEGSLFIPKQKKKEKTMTLGEITNYLQDWCHHGYAEKEVVFETSEFEDYAIKEVFALCPYPIPPIDEQKKNENKILLKFRLGGVE